MEGVVAAGVVTAKPDIPRVNFWTAGRGDLGAGLRGVVVLRAGELRRLAFVALGPRDVAGGPEKSMRSGVSVVLGTEKEKDDISKDVRQGRGILWRFHEGPRPESSGQSLHAGGLSASGVCRYKGRYMLSLRNGRRKAEGGRRRTGDTETCSRKREKKKNEGNPARGDEMRGMPGECARKRSFVRSLRQSAQSQERVKMQTDEIRRHVVRIRIGESGEKTIPWGGGSEFRLTALAKIQRAIGPRASDPHPRCPAEPRQPRQTSSSTASVPGPLWSLRIMLGINVRPLSALPRFLGSPAACHLHAPMTQTLIAVNLAPTF